MKTWSSLAFSGGVAAIAVTTGILLWTRPELDSRSVGPVEQAHLLTPPTLSRSQATGLFVGVRTFPHDDMLTVPYAVDDAVDLAYKFSLDQRSSLIPPRHVVLALSGTPQKEESQQRLRELKNAGARVENATSGDIMNLLKEQAAQTGTDGLLLFSLATHGFLAADGDAYILGSTSEIGSTETSLRTTTLFDIAGHATRSLIFVDACRERTGQTSRGATHDPATAAPRLPKRMPRGQVVFYAAAAGGYAVDDHVHRNGVFTKAVLDGLSCGASAPRGEVLPETLHKFVEREVRRWFKENRNVSVDPATQISMEGQTRNMPLSRCWQPTIIGDIHVATDGSTINAYDAATHPLWAKNLGEPIVHADVVDLDADAFQEVVVGTPGTITILDREGHELWKRTGDGKSLAAFTTEDLFRKHTLQIVAVWANERESRLTVLDSTGKELSRYDSTDPLTYVATGRATNMHAPKIAVTSDTSVFLLEPRKLTVLWHQALVSPTDAIRQLRIVDANNDSRREIAVTTKSGTTWFAFDGKIVRQGAQWRDAGKRKRRSPNKPSPSADATSRVPTRPRPARAPSHPPG